MWCVHHVCALFAGVAAVLVTAEGACDTNTLFFGDVNLSTLPPYQLTVVSAVGTYILEPNNVSLVAYRHTGRPDQFLLQQPSSAAKSSWVVATLPDNKKPAEVKHAYEAWPEAGNILARGEFEGEPWAPGAGAWEVNDCDEGRTPLPSLSLSCVAPSFGQCATDRWRVVTTADPTFVDVLTPADAAIHSQGRREFRSPSQRAYVGEDGRWRLASRSSSKVSLVSTTPAERLEYVRGWRSVADSGAEGDTDTKIECEPLRVVDAGDDPCASKPCKNNGTCLRVEGSNSAYHCRCRFDSVSPNCEAVRECKVPKLVANAQLLFTSDLSPQGKAFYRCDVGYYVKNGTGSSNKTTNAAFATCDGREWNNVPACEPITTTVTIEAAYVHHCNLSTGWCDGYQHAPTLTPSGRTLGWTLAGLATEEGRGKHAKAQYEDGGNVRQLALLQTPCMFVPTEGCVAVDVKVESKNATLTVMDDDEVTLWRTNTETDWTTATLTLPPGSNRLSFEAVLERSGAAVRLDNIRVFQWNCEQVTKLLFPPPPRSRSSSAMETAMPLLSLLLLLAYSGAVGVLTA